MTPTGLLRLLPKFQKLTDKDQICLRVKKDPIHSLTVSSLSQWRDLLLRLTVLRTVSTICRSLITLTKMDTIAISMMVRTWPPTLPNILLFYHRMMEMYILWLIVTSSKSSSKSAFPAIMYYQSHSATKIGMETTHLLWLKLLLVQPVQQHTATYIGISSPSLLLLSKLSTLLETPLQLMLTSYLVSTIPIKITLSESTPKWILQLEIQPAKLILLTMMETDHLLEDQAPLEETPVSPKQRRKLKRRRKKRQLQLLRRPKP